MKHCIIHPSEYYEVTCPSCDQDQASGSTTAQSEAMTKWMEEVTALLCFQPEVPLKHKEDLCAALNDYKQVLHAIEITEPQNNKLRSERE